MKCISKRIVAFALSIAFIQGAIASYVTASAVLPWPYSSGYSGGFELETIYRPNQTIHGWFKFKIDVQPDGSVTIGPDGSFRQLNYGWGDDYLLIVYDNKGVKKFDSGVVWWGDVYKDATRLQEMLSKLKINVGDSIQIVRTHYNKTVKWNLGTGTNYSNGSSRQYSYPTNKRETYLFTERGFVQQTLYDNVSNHAIDDIKHKVTFQVRNTRTGAVENRDVYYDFSGQYGSMKFDVSGFGETRDYVWNDNIEIYGYKMPDSYILGGVKFSKDRPVAPGVKELTQIVNDEIELGDYVKFKSDNSTLRLDDVTVVNNKNILTLFTNNNSKFYNGIRNADFYIGDSGLLQIN